MNIKAKKAKQKLQEIAKRTAKDIGYELGEIPKRTPGQLMGKDSHAKSDVGDESISPIVEAMQQSSDGEVKEPTKGGKMKFIKDKSKVDEDIEKYRRKREELKREWSERQNESQEDLEIQPGEPLPIPSSKRSRGRTHPGKQKSPEKKLGKK